MKRIGAFGWQTPEARSKVFATGSLKKIRIGDFHDIRRTPMEFVRRNQKIIFYRFHL